MKSQILVDSVEFWSNLKRDVLSAKKYVYLQTLSLEGDRVGIMLFDLLNKVHSIDFRILVDPYTKYMISDKFIYSPKTLFDGELIREMKATYRMIKHLRRKGVGVKFTKSHRSYLKKIFARDHKKLVVIDDKIAYIGGINFCDHNFSWHDMMVRIKDESVARFLKGDFLQTWKGQNTGSEKQFDQIKIYLLDGFSNETVFDRIFQTIENAKHDIYVFSPYLTVPFLQKFDRISRRGVAVTLITPELNNKKLVKEYIVNKLKSSVVKIRLYKNRMSHLKAILIDDDYLIAGSSNFDIISYRIQKELVAVISDPDVIAAFKERVLRRDMQNSVKIGSGESVLKGYVAEFGLQLIDRICITE